MVPEHASAPSVQAGGGDSRPHVWNGGGRGGVRDTRDGRLGPAFRGGARFGELLRAHTILAGEGTTSFAAMQRTAQTAAIDRTLAYTPYVRVAGRQHREIALTFDDGPGPYTPQTLSILQANRVPATFFEVGLHERYFHASTSRIVADGDTIGDHTMDHAPIAILSPASQRAQLLERVTTIPRYGAPFPPVFRSPYGLEPRDLLSCTGTGC
jgi:hypothetical protein